MTDIPIFPIGKSPESVWEYETVEVTEVGRFTPPDNIIWPSSLGFENQTIWWWGENGPILFTGSKPVKPKDEAGKKVDAVPAKVFTWDLGSGTIDSHTLDPQPTDSPGFFVPISAADSGENSESTIPPESGNEKQYLIYIEGAGASKTQSQKIGEGAPVPLPIISAIVAYRSDGTLSDRVEVDPQFNELEIHGYRPSIDNSPPLGFTFKNLIRHNVKMHDGTIRLTESRASIDLTGPILDQFDTIIDRVPGTEFLCYLENPLWVFSKGKIFSDPNEYTFIGSDDETVGIQQFQRPDKPDEPPQYLNVSEYIPSVRYGDDLVVFCDQGKVDDKNSYIVALEFHGDKLRETLPTILWESPVPNIFGLSTVITSESDRPYIVCLDGLNGNLTIFDPLTGSIRYQMATGLTRYQAGQGIASFCACTDPLKSKGTILIHDVGENRIIELKIETAPSHSNKPGIVPIESPPDI